MSGFHTASLADQVFEKLQNDIIQGVYPVGSIITELRLAEQLGVSRTPIREALRRLEQEHLIEDSAKGSVVLGITEENLMDIMDIRIQIEPMASYYAAKNRTEDDIKELSHIIDLQAFYCAKHDSEFLSHEDDDFHDAICRISGHRVIRDTLLPLHKKTRKYRKISVDDFARQEMSMKEHRQIFDAIVSGDADLASSLTANHILQAKNNMIKRLKKNG